uniref:RNA helicase n=1 Tax=Leptobrachium leishanense TaxID=445787 RepID=A0A8C5QSJ7_9ANUR
CVVIGDFWRVVCVVIEGISSVHLVQQHYQHEFLPVLKDRYKVIPISGDAGEERFFFANFVKENDVVICTAQILQNALIHQSEEKHVEMTDFTLLIIDECHHTHKNGVYNKLMEEYLIKKLRGERNLPQILGLTASPGTGRATSMEKAVEHIMQVCANLDTWRIMSHNEQSNGPAAVTKQPEKQYDLVSERAQDPFGDELKMLMLRIHEFLGDPDFPFSEFGTQTYEQKIVEMEKEGEKKRTCALHLRKYNDALFIHDTVRMIDAFRHLDRFYSEEKITRPLTDESERFLLWMYDEHQNVGDLANDARYENPKLSKLEDILRDLFQSSSDSRGIIFTRTRQSTHDLHDWIQGNAGLQAIGIKTAPLTGAGQSNQTKPMTQNEQLEVIERFRKGHLNLLLSTSVAEEGMDIPQCNIVVRYGLMTNETSMIQARGRARHEESRYSFLAQTGSKEMRREITNETLEGLMKQAIKRVQNMPEREYLQQVSVARVKNQRKDDLKGLFNPDDVILHCKGCNTAVARGSDIRVVENSQYVNVNANFKVYYKVSATSIVFEKKMDGWSPGRSVRCHCGQNWGFEMIYKNATLPIVSIKNFAIQTPESRVSGKKWKSVPFAVEDFNYSQYCQENLLDLSDDDD